MITITKEFSFDAAHLLDAHDGLCKNLHGHTYKLQVTITGELISTGSSEGMIIDYKDFKSIINENIINKIDHAFIYNQNNNNESFIAKSLEQINSKTYKIPYRTTSENLAYHFFKILSKNTNLKIIKIKLWETPNSSAEYYE